MARKGTADDVVKYFSASWEPTFSVLMWCSAGRVYLRSRHLGVIKDPYPLFCALLFKTRPSETSPRNFAGARAGIESGASGPFLSGIRPGDAVKIFCGVLVVLFSQLCVSVDNKDNM